MAAAIIPLVASTVVPMIPGLVAKLIEKIFGPKTGPVKAATGTLALQAIYEALRKLDPSIGVPHGQDTATTLQTVVEQLNAAGLLQGHATVIDQASAAQVAAMMPKSLLAIFPDGTYRGLNIG